MTNVEGKVSDFPSSPTEITQHTLGTINARDSQPGAVNYLLNNLLMSLSPNSSLG